jgi:hypothetical protein
VQQVQLQVRGLLARMQGMQLPVLPMPPVLPPPLALKHPWLLLRRLPQSYQLPPRLLQVPQQV